MVRRASIEVSNAEARATLVFPYDSDAYPLDVDWR